MVFEAGVPGGTRTQVCAIGGQIFTPIQRRHRWLSRRRSRARRSRGVGVARDTVRQHLPNRLRLASLTHGLSLYREGVSSPSNSVEPEPQQHVASGSGVVCSACHTSGSPDAYVRSSEHLTVLIRLLPTGS